MTDADHPDHEWRWERSWEPLVSVVIANHNGGAFIEEAIASALRQTVRDIEVIVVDDASIDDSVERVSALARRHPCLKLIRLRERTGPGGARNHGLLQASGRWIAVLDSDDLMHPQRLEALIKAARDTGAEIVADNQMVFDDARLHPAHPLLDRGKLPSNGLIDVARYIDCNSVLGGDMPLGYLKPLFLRSFMQANGGHYDPRLVIAEDFDLVLRLLLSGGRLLVLPEMTYFYRRHARSISHRLSAATLLPMLAADAALRAATPLAAPVAEALDRRRETIHKALAFETLIDAMRRRRWMAALRIAMARPDVAALLRVPLRDRMLRLTRRLRHRASAPPGPSSPQGSSSQQGLRVSLLSRQRVIGGSNGSSAYLLSLCARLRQAGYAVELVSPSPAMFGRWPILRLSPAMDVFSAIRIRGAIRLGPLVIARDPRIALRAATAVAHRLLRRLHVRIDRLDRRAAHAIAVPLADADRCFIADATRRSTVLLADYAFLAEAIPFALQPRARSAVVMHDLFCAQDPDRAVVRIDQQGEMALLDQADAVIAIQAEEAATVARLLPRKRVILAPMAVRPARQAQPGENGTILFVGSNTQPNIDAITWFLRQVWPRLLERAPQARLWIAGACCAGIGKAGPNVSLLGRIDDLDEPYRRAAIVISPLRLGSGLKIKLVEALGRGKAIIATETTLQGVGTMLAGAVVRADQPSEFLAAFADLLDDNQARALLGARALAAARRHFSPEACYEDLLGFVREAGTGTSNIPVALRIPEGSLDNELAPFA